MRFRLFAVGLGFLLLASLRPACAAPIYVRFNTTIGNIDVELFQDTAPLNVANFMSYVNSGAYNNVIINRCLPGFVFQAGEYTLVSNSSGNSIGSNTPGSPVQGEAGLPGAHSNTRGTIAFALSANQTTGVTDPNSGTNQWFFNLVDNNSASSPANLDSQGFTAFGIVMNTSSLSIMDGIAGEPVPPLNANPFVTAAEYAQDQNPDDYPFGHVPLINYNASNGLLVSNLVLVNSVTQLTTVQDFPTWQNTYFNGQPTSVSAPTATPLNDGVTNLLKYVCDINPTVPMTAAVRAKLPTIGKTTISGTQYLTLTYHQHDALLGVTVNVQTSPDLQTWTTVTNPTIVQHGTDSGGDPIEQVVVASSGTTQFIRLNVTMP